MKSGKQYGVSPCLASAESAHASGSVASDGLKTICAWCIKEGSAEVLPGVKYSHTICQRHRSAWEAEAARIIRDGLAICGHVEVAEPDLPASETDLFKQRVHALETSPRNPVAVAKADKLRLRLRETLHDLRELKVR